MVNAWFLNDRRQVRRSKGCTACNNSRVAGTSATRLDCPHQCTDVLHYVGLVVGIDRMRLESGVCGWRCHSYERHEQIQGYATRIAVLCLFLEHARKRIGLRCKRPLIPPDTGIGRGDLRGEPQIQRLMN